MFWVDLFQFLGKYIRGRLNLLLAVARRYKKAQASHVLLDRRVENGLHIDAAIRHGATQADTVQRAAHNARNDWRSFARTRIDAAFPAQIEEQAAALPKGCHQSGRRTKLA